MARQILFRGKTKNGGQWVHGAYCPPCNIVWQEWDELTGDEVIKNEEILPETLGQYIGVCDRDGNSIYEGDIIHIVFEDDGEGNVEEQNLAVIYRARSLAYMLADSPDGLGFVCPTNSSDWIIRNGEIIGNVHDNPELLK